MLDPFYMQPHGVKNSKATTLKTYLNLGFRNITNRRNKFKALKRKIFMDLYQSLEEKTMDNLLILIILQCLMSMA